MSKYMLNLSEREMVAASGFVATVAGESKSMGLANHRIFDGLEKVIPNPKSFTGINKKPKYDHVKSRTEKGFRPRNPMQFSSPQTQILFSTSPESISFSTWREIMGNVKTDKVVPTRKQLLDMVVLDFVSSRVGNTRKIMYTHNRVTYKLAIQQVENSRRG